MDRFGPDEDTLNRLGKAYTELGQHDDAVEAYKSTLKMNPVNPIAQKNLAKLQTLPGGQPVPTSKARVDVDAFIEETGKTALTALHVHSEGDPCSKVAGGDPVKLIVAGDTMNVETARGIALGHLEHALGRRLIKFLEGGNRYSGAVATCEGGAVKIIVRETYQDPKFFRSEGDPCSKVAGGDPVKLIVAGDTMNVETARGIALGHLEHALGRRLIKFLEGGNRYSGAVATCEGGAVKIIVRETYQDPKFFGRPS